MNLFSPAAAIAAGGAFLISLIMSLLSLTPFFAALLRALFFGGVFFGVTTGIYFIYNKFLLPADAENTGKTEDSSALGQNIDYTIDDNSEWLAMPEDSPEYSGENIPPEDISGGIDDTRVDEYGGEHIEEAPSGMGEASAPEALEQNADYVYNKDEGLAQPAKVKEHVSSEYGFDMDMSDFVAGSSAFDGGEYPAMADAHTTPYLGRNGGTVDMSVARKPGEANINFDVDGKKMAGTIRTLLKKDEG
jgi:hypothetical protein